jgi:hypothetical protein
MNNVIVGSHIVCRAMNPSTRVLEYTIHELGNRVLINEPEPKIVPEPLLVPALVPGADVYSDVVYLYTNVLLLYWVTRNQNWLSWRLGKFWTASSEGVTF